MAVGSRCRYPWHDATVDSSAIEIPMRYYDPVLSSLPYVQGNRSMATKECSMEAQFRDMRQSLQVNGRKQRVETMGTA